MIRTCVCFYDTCDHIHINLLEGYQCPKANHRAVEGSCYIDAGMCCSLFDLNAIMCQTETRRFWRASSDMQLSKSTVSDAAQHSENADADLMLR